MNIRPASHSCFRHGGFLATIVLALLAVNGAVRPAFADAAQALPASPASATDRLSHDELEELLGPIALYPDSLLANVLAASVFPDDIAAAQAMRRRGGDPVANGDSGWDPSVGMVATFPDVLSMMADYAEWTTAVGRAYLIQAGDVMDVIQSLRAIAWDNGALQTTTQQVVVREGPTIIIEPADPQVIFVPVYSPQVVFVRNPVSPVAVGVISFGVGVAVGSIWSSNVHCNWGGRCVSWGPGWWGRRNNVNINVNNNNNTNVNINRPGGRPGAGGSPWRPNPDRNSSGQITRPGGGGGNRVPGDRIPGGRPGIGGGVGGGGTPTPPIARPDGRPSNRPSGGAVSLPSRPPGGTGGINRPTGGTARPSPPQTRPPNRPQAPNAPPSISRPGGGSTTRPAPGFSPPNRGVPAARPAAPSRPSGYRPGGGGGGGRPVPARPAGGAGAGAGSARPGGARGR